DPGGAGHRSDAMGLTGRSRAVQRSGFPDWFPVRHCLPSLWPHLGVHSACIYLLICTRTSKMRQLFPSLTALQRPSENRTLCLGGGVFTPMPFGSARAVLSQVFIWD